MRRRTLVLALTVGALLTLVALMTVVTAGVSLAQTDMAGMRGMSGAPALPLGVPMSRLGSGTSWLPDSSRLRAAMWSPGAWTLMLEGNAFGQYDHQTGLRGTSQLGLVDWEMLMATHALAGGAARLDAMTSLEPLVDSPRGYPELLQTGGAFRGARIVDHQHPHDLVMELAGAFDHAVMSDLAWSVYAAAVGEPALGPVDFMHRPSAADDPFAPLGHHMQDATHEAFGVVTTGLYTRAVKLEGSVFNAREPDAYHLNLDYTGARLDSYSGRLTVAPSGRVALAAWGGYLFDDDPLERGLGMQRYGASALTAMNGIGGGAWSTAVVWGLNVHHHGPREHNHDANAVVPTHHMMSSVLVESTLEIGARDAVFGRIEQVQKSGDDLGFIADGLTQLFNVRELALGATHELLTAGGASVGVGARAAVELLPSTLRNVYETTRPFGFAVYVRVRPAAGR